MATNDNAIPPFKIVKPKKEKKQVVTVYLPSNLKERVNRAAERNSRSFSSEVTHRLNRSFGKDDA
jgi:cytidylate kinase